MSSLFPKRIETERLVIELIDESVDSLLHRYTIPRTETDRPSHPER